MYDGTVADVATDEINRAIVDRYTIGHFSLGVLYGTLKMPWWLALIFTVGFEIVERPLKRHSPMFFPAPSQDSLANSIGDSTAVMLGWAVGRSFWRRKPKA